MAALRCKVGDLIVVKKPYDSPKNVGRFGTIVRRGLARDWVVKPQSTFAGWLRGSLVDDAGATEFPDDALMPIRDPGADAVDETLIYAGDPRVREVCHG